MVKKKSVTLIGCQALRLILPLNILLCVAVSAAGQVDYSLTEQEKKDLIALEVSERYCDSIYETKIDQIAEVKMQLRYITRELGLSIENDSLMMETTLNLKARQAFYESELARLEGEKKELEKEIRKLKRRKNFWKTIAIVEPVAIAVAAIFISK